MRNYMRKQTTVRMLIILAISMFFCGCESGKKDSNILVSEAENIPVLEYVPENMQEEAENYAPRESLEVAADIAEDRIVSQISEKTESDEIEEESENSERAENTGFYIKEIDDAIFARINGKSYKEDCPIPIEDLRYIHLLHKDIKGEIHEGEMIVNAYIAEDVLEIFKELYEVSYPIEKVRLVDEYEADDELSMEDNNSSAFNYRSMAGSAKISKHGLGMAIDINTLYNPYVKDNGNARIIEPETAGDYVDRESDFPYKIMPGDDACRIFKEHGFTWGGDWNSLKDYQHFEVSTDEIRSVYSWY